MAASSTVRRQDPPSRRRGLRYPVEFPLDVTIVRSGKPDTVPGRSVNLSLRGVAAVLAGDLRPGETVGVVIGPPHMQDRPDEPIGQTEISRGEDRLRLRARVRHQEKLRCGMEFFGLSAEQRNALRSRIKGKKPEPRSSAHPQVAARKGSGIGGLGGSSPPPVPPYSAKPRSRGWLFLLLSAAILLGVLWWRWNRGWEDLESGLRKTETKAQPQAHVPADVMEKLVKHRVDPDYPAAARPGKLQGVIVLDVVVGSDGSVSEVRALNGPEILAQAATDAMRWWRFEPYRVDGKPVVAETTVAVEFRP
jgi:TonB family protein